MIVYIMSDPKDSQLILTTDPVIVAQAREFAAEANARGIPGELECQEWDTDTPLCSISLKFTIDDAVPVDEVDVVDLDAE